MWREFQTEMVPPSPTLPMNEMCGWFDDGYVCTERERHKGPHMASGVGHMIAYWTGA